MANQNDSFIDEVTDELRRDRLFGLFRRYGWIAVVVILATVGGAIWREVSLSRQATKAQSWGDAVIAAEASGDPAAMTNVDPLGSADRKALAALLAADEWIAAGTVESAVEPLKSVAVDNSVNPVLQELAQLKRVMLQDVAMDPTERDQILMHLSRAGAPFELLALEQKAVALIGAGRGEDAVTLIRQIQEKPGVSQALRRRLAEMMIVLGENPEKGDVLTAE